MIVDRLQTSCDASEAWSLFRAEVNRADTGLGNGRRLRTALIADFLPHGRITASNQY